MVTILKWTAVPANANVQVVLALIILGLTSNLLIRYQKLNHGCGPSPHSERCDVIAELVGAFKYGVVPPALALIDVAVWVIDSWVVGLNWYFVVWCEWVVQGFYLGGGSVSF